MRDTWEVGEQQAFEDAIDHARRMEASYPRDEKTADEVAWLDSLERGELPKGDER
jgi:hypothetical protein